MRNMFQKILDSDLMEKAMLVMAHIGIIACVVCIVIKVVG